MRNASAPASPPSRRIRKMIWLCLSPALMTTFTCSHSLGSPIASGPVACQASTCEQASQADLFADSIGFDVPIYWENAFNNMLPLLSNAGVRHARVGLCQDQNQCRFFQNMLQAGIHGTVIIGYNSSATQIAQALAANGPIAEGAFIEAMEGINEPNNSGLPGYTSNWIANTRSTQMMLWNTVQSSGRSGQVKVLGPSICCNSSDQSALGDLTPYLDYGNQHVYFGQQNPGAIFYTGATVTDFNLQLQTAISGKKPVQTTETGWGSLLSDPASGVSPSIQQRYIVRGYLESFAHGVPRTFDYVFTDDPSAGAGYGSYGVVSVDANANLTPKPAYYAVANLLSLIQDPGASFQPTGLSYNLSGDAASVDHLLLQKRDGSFYLILWTELMGWDPTKQVAKSYAPQTVTINISTPLWGAETYSYDLKGSGSLRRAKLSIFNNSASVVVSDQATVVHLVPLTAPTTQSVAPANPGFSTIMNANSGMCLFVVNASPSAGAAVDQIPCTTGRNEQFTVTQQSDGYYLLRDDDSRNCVQVSGSGSGAAIRTVAGCSAADQSQEFSLRQIASSSYALVSRQSNLCIDVPGASTVAGAQMQTNGCNGARSQTWTIPYLQ